MRAGRRRVTYGLERLAMYVQGVDNIFDINFNGRHGAERVTYGDVSRQAEEEYSRYNFDYADTQLLLRHFEDAEQECGALLKAWSRRRRQSQRHRLALPAYDQCIKASHLFNLLDARGVISVTERQSYILRVRELAKQCGRAWAETPKAAGPACMPDLLFELFSEEIPARMQLQAADDLRRIVTGALVEAGLL